MYVKEASPTISETSYDGTRARRGCPVSRATGSAKQASMHRKEYMYSSAKPLLPQTGEAARYRVT